MSTVTLETSALSWLLTYLVHSTLLLGGAWFLCGRRIVRSERIKEILWKTALVGGVVTASLQVFAGLEPFGGRWRLEGPPATEWKTPELVARAFGSPAARPTPAAAREPSGIALAQPRFADSTPVPAPDFTFPATATPLGATPPATRTDLHWMEWALAGWALGGAGLLLLFALAWMRLRDHLAGRQRLVEGPLPGLLAHLRRKAGLFRPVRLSVSPRLRAPVALGTLFPQICIPPRALTDLSRAQQEAMLAHELGHVARFDPFWLRLCRLLETVLFFQPLNRLARRRLGESAEFLCDDWAVAHTQDRLELAHCLAEVASWLIGAPRLRACGMADLRSPLGERVERLLEPAPSAEHAARWLVPVAAGIVGATALVAPGFSGSSAEPSEPVARLEPSEPAPLAPEETPADEPLEAVLSDVTWELNTFEAEIEELRAEAGRRGVPDQLTRRIDDAAGRAQRIRARKDRIEDLLARLTAGRTELSGPSADGSDEPEE